MARLEIALDGNIKGLQKALRSASYEISNFGANIKGTNLTAAFQKTEQAATKAAREIKTEFSDSFKEVEAAIKASGATAGNWSNQIVRSANAVAPPVRRAKVVFDGLNRSLQYLPRSVSGFGILTNQTQALTRNLQRVSLTANAATRSLVGVGRQGAAGIRGGTSAAISFGHIIQDLPYGINGVANNITQLTTQMGYMAASAKASGVSMKAALLGSIMNPANLAVLGISVLTTAMVYFTGKVGSAKKETDELAKSFKSLDDIMNEQRVSTTQELSQLGLLRTTIENVNIAISDRKAAVDELQRLYPSIFSNLKDEDILVGNVSGAYEKLTANILATAQARNLQKSIDENISKYDDLTTKIGELDKQLFEAKTQTDELSKALSLGGAVRFVNSDGSEGISIPDPLNKVLQERNKLDEERKQLGLDNLSIAERIQKIYESTEGIVKDILGGQKGITETTAAASDSARKAIKDISTDALKITTPLNEGLNKAAKDFERGLVGAIAKAAGALTTTDFAEVYTTAQKGTSGIQVQPILTPKDVPTEPGVKIADEWGRAMGRATDRFSRDFYSALEDIAAQGKLTLGGVFSGVVQSFTSSFQNIFVQHFSEKLKASFSDLSSSFSTKMQGAIAAVGIAGGLLQSTGTAAGQIAGGALSGAASGALLGASIGTVGGPLGAVVGGVVGLIGGIFGSNKKREEIQKQQLEQLKKAVAYTSQVIGKFVAGVGVVENVSLNTYGELTARVKGKDLEFVLSQQQAATARGI